ncbi:MAG: heme NO-binding domain-containing protein [Bacteroidetes bacterium]|nr:heme NO-binding domain-containing protein [Bacteroidota bacterium]
MKGVIVKCLADMVTEKFGKNKWEDSLEKAGIPRTTFFLTTQDVDDALTMKVIASACEVLKITTEQAAAAFGDYWVNDFAVKVYKPFYSGLTSAKEFLLNLDKVHVITTQTIPNAHPPRFDYEWKDPKTLIMTYKSPRGLIEFFIGLAHGVGKHFHEELKITKLSSDKVEIIFS